MTGVVWDKWNDPDDLSIMVGKVPFAIEQDNENDEIVFIFEDGFACKFYHDQCCCESVTIDDVNGDWNDLIGVPLLVAEDRSDKTENYDQDDCHTWTFYTFRSIKGSVDVKWYGESNGYYSEEVDFKTGKVTE